MIARVAYALLFVVALPLLLVAWATRLDVLLTLPAYHEQSWGLVAAGAGIALVAAAMRDLWVIGGGLPASPFPPAKLVTRGVYALVPHPIYVGSVVVSFGVSLWSGSAAGLWVVTPVLALMAASWVIGFENDETRTRFGALPNPALRLPSPTSDPPTPHHRVAVVGLVFVPWLALFYGVEFLGVPPDARSTYFAWDLALPVIPWTEGVYALTYLLCAAAPLVAKTQRDLRVFARDGLWATALIIPFYLLVPLVAEAKPVSGDGFLEALLRWERIGDAPVTAYPSFHVVWTCIAASLFVACWPRLRVTGYVLVAAVGVSCVTTGMHSASDVVAGLVAYAVVVRRRAIWERVRSASEYLANSWREVHIGPIRLASHGIYTGTGASVGVAVAVGVAGAQSAWWITGMTLAAIVGAGLWAQVIEGSPQLLRPYGYFGSVFTVLAIALVAGFAGVDAWLLTAAMATGASFAHAIGRLRCLVHGCCHGRAAPVHLGIRYTQPMTRVVRLSTLGGVLIHPVQIYSLLSMLFVGAVLFRLWSLAAPLQFIAGAYLILVGLFRFAEEHFRGEPQTAVIGGLRLYQWLSIAFVVLGAVLTGMGASPAPAPAGFAVAFAPAIGGVGVISFFAYGGDFPGSSRRFSRLR